MKKIVALTAVLLVLVLSMGSGITGTHRACASDIVSQVTGETAPPVPPIADADGPYSCYVHETILLDGSGSYDPDGTIIIYEWNFGDETTGTGEKPSHTYSKTGTFTVTLTVTDNHDLTDDDTTTVKVSSRPTPPPPPPPLPPPNKKPKADAGPNQKVWVNRTILFSGAGSYDEDGIIISYNWDFSDGRMALGVDVSHVYSEPGHHTVTLTVKDNRLDEDSDTCIVKVYEVPAPFVGELSELVPAGKKGHIVNASKEANTMITLNTTSRVTVTVLKYERNPYPEDPINATTVQLYADVMVSISEAVEWPIYVEMHYTDEDVEGLDEDSLGIYYWFNGTWQRCNDTGVDTERNVVWAYMTAEEASGSPILVGGTLAPPLPPILSNLTVKPEEVEIGNNVTIGVNIENIDSQSFTYNFTMQIGELTLLIDVELESYESKTVKRTITPSFVGLYDVQVDGLVCIFEVKTPPKPAEFEFSDLTIVPVKVEPGEEVEISLLVKNIGELQGSHMLSVLIENGQIFSWVSWIDLEGRTNETVRYRFTPEAEGNYNVDFNDLTGSFEVKIIPSAGFELSNLTITPKKIELGEEITVSFVITNADSRPFVYVPHVQIGEITIMDDVELEGHESKVIVHIINQETAGNFEVEVNGLMGSFKVKPIVSFWMRPGTIAVIIIVIIAAAALLYVKWKGILPTLYPEIDDEI